MASLGRLSQRVAHAALQGQPQLQSSQGLPGGGSASRLTDVVTGGIRSSEAVGPTGSVICWLRLPSLSCHRGQLTIWQLIS